MTSEDWSGRALAAVVARIGVTAAEVGTRFPLYAEPGDGTWKTTGRGSWAGGFWAGLLWLRARISGRRADQEAAAACTARLEPWVDADTATRGLIFWYGTALAGEDDARAVALRDRAARACAAAFDPGPGMVPWGGAFGGPRLLARVDGVPGMVPLLAGAGPEAAAVAAGHLHRHLDVCLGEGPRQGTWPHPAWSFDSTVGWQPCADPPSDWSRGNAWLLLAVADGLLRAEVLAGQERLAEAAGRMLTEGGFLTGPLVAPARTTRPDGPLDTSAAAITAVALLKLAGVPGPRAAACWDRAVAILHHLTAAHLCDGEADRPAGMLLNGCYDADKGRAVRHELVWGDFFLGLGLASLAGVVDITRV
ncbi:sugar ABC transporter permease [Streptomyces sp. NPDC046866]|uniref:sugar ABC transporter permease n=1 Tax=Streptomyces sp. NPDC046866 TaxID=3154921 RepID=UPI0034562852